jgi:hypothetical protein
MTTRAVSPGSGWRWFRQAINLGRNNPKAIFGAAALVAVIALIPSVIQLVLQYGLGLDPAAVMAVIGLTTVASILIYPLLIGGLLRVIHSAESGAPTHATAIFDTFGAGADRGRLIGFGLLMTALYIGVFLLVISLFGKEFMSWYWQLITAAQAQQAGGAAVSPDMMALPEGFGRVMGIGSLFALFMGGVYAIGFGQVALGGRSVGAALGDGLGGTLKNVLPMVLLAVLAVVAMFALALVVGIVAGILMLVGGLVHKALGVLLLAPIYLGMLLVIYVVMFGVMYFMWRDICGDDTPLADTPRDDSFAA